MPMLAAAFDGMFDIMSNICHEDELSPLKSAWNWHIEARDELGFKVKQRTRPSSANSI